MVDIKPELINDTIPFDRSGFMRDIQSAMVSVTADGQRFIAKYPAQTLRKSGYRRTGTLKRSWSSKVTASTDKITGIIGSNKNIAPYNKAVQGSPQSKLFAASTWRNIDDLRKVVDNDLNKRAEAIAEKHTR
jgi:hypothetical protein